MSDARDRPAVAAGIAADFAAHRARIFGVAYRMLGSVAEAEDVVQDTFVRFLGAARDEAREEVRDVRAFLVTTAGRLALDRLASARVRRESYVGAWPPEPLVHDATASPEDAAELAQDLSIALLMTLERLSPFERAAFLLHDVFDQDYADVAAALGKSEDAARQLAARARAHVKGDAKKADVSLDASPSAAAARLERRRALADAFRNALLEGDLGALQGMLAEDAVLYSDGGGKRLAALNPIFGRERILRFIDGVSKKGAAVSADDVRGVIINGGPGFIARDAAGHLETLALDVDDDGRVVALYIVRNPDKLEHVRW